jgi:hypothetical protein
MWCSNLDGVCFRGSLPERVTIIDPLATLIRGASRCPVLVVLRALHGPGPLWLTSDHSEYPSC